MLTTIDSIHINIETAFIPEQTIENHQYLFSYTITITNNAPQPLQLKSCYWLITDANCHVSTVEGEGVVGQQPLLRCGESYTYTSGCVLKTPLGSMQGYYIFEAGNGEQYKAPIPIFTLAKPNAVH